MTNAEELLPATEKDTEGINWEELKQLGQTWEQQDTRLRKLYLEHPDRKQFFAYDFVEILWYHVLEYYGKSIGNVEVEDAINEFMEDHRLHELVYDIGANLAERKGWEMK